MCDDALQGELDAAAGPHYNHEVAVDGKALPSTAVPTRQTAAEVSPKTEVWFDLVPNADGMAY